eukprot:10474047-Karenia_brevis.AAC.1
MDDMGSVAHEMIGQVEANTLADNDLELESDMDAFVADNVAEHELDKAEDIESARLQAAFDA